MSELKCIDCGEEEQTYDPDIRKAVEQHTGLKPYAILCVPCNKKRHDERERKWRETDDE